MLKNFWRIAIRQLGKQKFYAAVKIGGFALGIAACLLIGLYIRNQLSYDHDFPGADRAKEVGLRKVVGSDRQGLIRQFLLESMVTSGFSFLLAIGLAVLLLPLFNKLAGTSMHFPGLPGGWLPA
jgi:hypothetical protein